MNSVTKNIKLKVFSPSDNFFKNNHKQKKLFDSSDGICIPQDLGAIAMKTGVFVTQIKSSSGTVYGKSIRYDAPKNCIILPSWMASKINIVNGNYVTISFEKIESITDIKFTIPKNIVDPHAILEFELRNRNVLSNGDIVKSTIFDKTYNFYVKEIKTASGLASVGTLFDNNIVSNINFVIE